MGETAKRTLGLESPPAEMNQLRNSRSGEPVSIFALLTTADKVDYLLMFFGSVAAVIHGAAMPVFFVLFGHMIDSLGQLSSHPLAMSSRVSQYSLYLVYLGLIVFVSAWMGVAFWAQTGERQAARLRLNYLEAVLKKEIGFFDAEGGNKNLIHHISSDAILVQDAIGDKIGHSFRYLSQFIVGFLIGFASVWQLTLLTLAVFPLIAIAGGVYTMIMSTLSKKCEASYAEAGKVAEEIISQIRTVYSFVGEDKAVEAYSRSLQRALKVAKKCGFAKGIGIGSTYGLLFCAWGLLLWYASVLVRQGRTNGGKAFTTIINVIFSGFALGQAAPTLAAIAKGRSAAANILSLIKTDARSCNRFNCGMMFSRLEGKIEFCRVSFSYPSRSEVIFEDLSFSITAGKTFAFVGPSGSGKSTIISLIQRFYDPISGKILLDGHDLRDLQLKWLREQMGLVNEEPVLFATTIAGNILYGKDDADMMQVIIAAKAANAHSFIEALPDGYNTQVGEGGIQLSGGQKQIIAVARAVLRNPKILLLDEATSALDIESELLVQNALDVIMSNRTSIVVAHRLSTIREVDTIVMLNNGQVVESGSHEELMSREGEYAALFSSEVSNAGRYPCEETIQDDPEFKGSKEPYVNQNEGEFVNSSSSRAVRQHGPKLIPEVSHPTPSFVDLVKLNATEWPFTVLGSIGAALAGVEAPVFALGVTYLLTALYSHDDARIKNDVRLISFIFVGVSVVTIPTYLLQHFFYTLMGERITANVRLLMFSAILSNEVGWFDSDENSVGALTSKLAADATLVRSALADRLSTIVQNVTLTVAAFAIAFKLSWRLAALTTAMFPLLIGASIAEQLFLQGFGGDYSSAYSRTTSIAREAISNIRTAAAFGAEERISRQFAAELNQPNKQALLRGHISGFFYGISQLLALCSYALTLWYASVLIKRSDSNFGDIMKSFMVLIVTAFAVAETLALTPEMVKGSQALGSVFSILHRKTTIDTNDPSSKAVTDIRGEVEFKSVTFRYPTRQDITVLNDLNLKIPAGKSLAVVGRSGSGKSTLIALVMRYYDPGHGSILIDGSDIRSLNLKSLRLKIGLVQQEPTLFSTTIYENIRYGNEKATEIEILKAAKAANAHGFISRLPEGYSTRVGYKGLQLSGGQKQRVAIARAIVKDPSILLLDEATSALDTVSEKVVQEALDKLMEGRTTILVAHRLSTIRTAESIAVLLDGKVAEIGGHEELIGKPGSIYGQLISQQHDTRH